MYLKTLNRSGSRGDVRPSTSPDGVDTTSQDDGFTASSLSRPTTSPAHVRLDLIPESKALDGSSPECVAFAKAVTDKVLKFLDSAQTRFEVAERLLLLQEAEEAEEMRYAMWAKAKGEGLSLEEFTVEESKRFKRFRRRIAPVDHYVHNIAESIERDEEKKASEEDRFELNEHGELVQRPNTFSAPTMAEEHVGIFNPHDIRLLFREAEDADEGGDER